MRFEPGSIVQLKSGGPTMTVVSADDEGVRCIWYAEATDEIRNAVIAAVALDLVELVEDDDDD